jgi:Spy/CpxP family protein refolding chaperone
MRLGRLSSVFLTACLLFLTTSALAQRPGGGGPPPGGGMPGGGGPAGGSMPSGPSGNNGGFGGTRVDTPTTSSPTQKATTSTSGGLELGPPGRWWDDKHFAKTLHLRPDQQKRMDGLFDENRTNLVSRYEALQQEESKMEALSHGQTLDEGALFSQIDRVAQARAELEKAKTHLALQVRKEMTADQIERLDGYR